MTKATSINQVADHIRQSILSTVKSQRRIRSGAFWNKFKFERRTKDRVEAVKAALADRKIEINLEDSFFGLEKPGDSLVLSIADAELIADTKKNTAQIKKHPNTNENDERQYWVWVTGPRHYLDEFGKDREDLDPESGLGVESTPDCTGWWTCNKNTQKGDLILLYRSRLNRDLGYLMQAESDAYSIVDDNYASEHNWDYGCDYRVLYKFKNPITLKEMRTNPYLDDWGAYRANFQRRVYAIPSGHWKRLEQMATENNPDYAKFLGKVEQTIVVKSIRLEEELEDALIEDLNLLKPFGYDLELCVSPIDGASGRQLICKGNGGRIDLLCFDRKKKQYVVVELKNVRAGQNTFGQISNYIGWVQDRIAKGKPVIGLVISRGYDAKFQSSMKITDKIFQLDIEQLGFM